MSGIDEILAGYDGLQASQEAFYKDLHEHPELSHQEHRTAQQVAGKLRDYGFTVEEHIGGTGVVGALANGRAGRAGALRTGRAAGQGGHRRAVREHGDHPGCRRAPGAGGPRLRP